MLFVGCFSENKRIDQAKCYLKEYGFIESNEEHLQSVNITDALSICRKYYKLSVDENCINNIHDLISKPRCGISDINFDFRMSAFEWCKPIIIGYFYSAKQEVLELTRKYFVLLKENSSIRFISDRVNSGMLVSNKGLKHVVYNKFIQCSYEFDGKKGILEHAFNTGIMNSRRKDHIDDGI